MPLADTAAAIIGTGFMARTHIEGHRRIDVQIAGILGSSPERSRNFADQHGLSTFAGWEEVLADPAVKSVHLCVPNWLHFQMAKSALLAGKHVICEKPLAMTSAETCELVHLSKSLPNLKAGVNYNNRYYPLLIEAKSAVSAGDLGRIFHITGSVTQDWLLYDTDYNWRLLNEEQGALRAMADIGSHWLDLMHFVTGQEVESICSDLSTVHSVRHRPKGEVETFAGTGSPSGHTEPIQIENDDYGAVLIRFKGGAHGSFFVSQVTAGRKYRVAFEIAAQSSSMAWNSERCEELWLGSRNRANRTLLRDPSLLGNAARGASDYPGGHTEGYPDTFKMCFRDFYGAIARADSAAPTYPTFEDGHRSVLIGEAILKSHLTGGWVDVSEENR